MTGDIGEHTAVVIAVQRCEIHSYRTSFSYVIRLSDCFAFGIFLLEHQTGNVAQFASTTERAYANDDERKCSADVR